jgi:Trypsin-co-occurring domain 1
MQVVKDAVGETTVFIQTVDDDLEIINSTSDEPDIIDTSIEDRVQSAYVKARSLIKRIAEDIGEDLGAAHAMGSAQLKQVEVSFSLGFAAKADAWILGTSGQYTLNVKIVWEPKANA